MLCSHLDSFLNTRTAYSLRLKDIQSTKYRKIIKSNTPITPSKHSYNESKLLVNTDMGGTVKVHVRPQSLWSHLFRSLHIIVRDTRHSPQGFPCHYLLVILWFARHNGGRCGGVGFMTSRCILQRIFHALQAGGFHAT